VLTHLTLPEAQPMNAPVQYDESQKAWTVLYPDLNMRILGTFRFRSPTRPGRTIRCSASRSARCRRS
jgi:hypothetical protein